MEGIREVERELIQVDSLRRDIKCFDQFLYPHYNLMHAIPPHKYRQRAAYLLYEVGLESTSTQVLDILDSLDQHRVVFAPAALHSALHLLVKGEMRWGSNRRNVVNCTAQSFRSMVERGDTADIFMVNIDRVTTAFHTAFETLTRRMKSDPLYYKVKVIFFSSTNDSSVVGPLLNACYDRKIYSSNFVVTSNELVTKQHSILGTPDFFPFNSFVARLDNTLIHEMEEVGICNLDLLTFYNPRGNSAFLGPEIKHRTNVSAKLPVLVVEGESEPSLNFKFPTLLLEKLFSGIINHAQLDAMKKLGAFLSPFITKIKGAIAGGITPICSAIGALVGALEFILLTGPAALTFLALGTLAPVALIVGSCVVVVCVIGGVVSIVISTRDLKTAVRQMIDESKKKNPPEYHNKFCDEMTDLFHQVKISDKKIN